MGLRVLKSIAEWMGYKWRRSDQAMLQHYRACFASQSGRVVLQHLMDNVYCVVDQSADPMRALVHNARRSVVHEILMNIDMAENPQKHLAPVETSNGVV